MSSPTPEPFSLHIKLGSKISDSIVTATAIKDTMAKAIIVMLEQNLITSDDPCFKILQKIYFESDHAVHELQQL